MEKREGGKKKRKKKKGRVCGYGWYNVTLGILAKFVWLLFFRVGGGVVSLLLLLFALALYCSLLSISVLSIG